MKKDGFKNIKQLSYDKQIILMKNVYNSKYCSIMNKLNFRKFKLSTSTVNYTKITMALT